MAKLEINRVELKKSIEQLAFTLEQKIAADDLDNITPALNQYAEKIKNYIVQFSTETDKETLAQEIQSFLQHNQRAVRKISEKRDELKQTLTNLNHIKQYLNV